MQDEAFSSIDLVSQCLIDEPRSLAFEQAIKNIVKPTDITLDCGTGSGLMALFTARAGAKEVYALEFDPLVAKIAQNNFTNNGFTNIKELFIGDARSFEFPTGTLFDVVVMEMLTTGMVDEYQVQAINNLHRQGVVNEHTTFIPKTQKTFATLVHSKSELYGLSFKMVTHLWNNLSEHLHPIICSDSQLVSEVHFSELHNEISDTIHNFTAAEDGIINGVLLTSETILTDAIILKDTETLNAPVVIPLDDISVTKGDTIKIHIRYMYGGGYGNFNVEKI